MAGKFLSLRKGWLLLPALLLGGCFFHSHKPSGGGAVSALPPGQRHAEGYQYRVSGSPAGYKVVSFAALPQWAQQDFGAGLEAFRKSCLALKNRPQWQSVCAQAGNTRKHAARQFFETYFTPWEVNHNGQLGGTITGYYEPVLQGSTQQTVQARFPIYGVPNDLVTVPLVGAPQSGSVRIRLTGPNSGQIATNGEYTANLADFPGREKSRTLKGRISGSRLVPYYTRAEINAGALSGRAPVLAYANDPVELFFLHIQGSGRLRTPDGRFVRLGFADKNDHPYASIGRYMADRGYLPLAQTSMPKIRDWLRAHPDKLAEVLGKNPSYVFFRQLPDSNDGPIGSLGVPLTGGYSGAVDKRFITLGAPLFLATAHPETGRALNRLMMAQDTGSAINGAVRVDFFWGYGDEAGRVAGRMKQTGYVWQLLPNGMLPQQ
ncbi:murein transglycosylase A [Eikenella sp. S3360]|uniref:peptidoglycan lytic exotransglycosylase n=1 Tax=Eikenella glucosivorans TaxID=2766967 RepID=A0ABS0N8I8_9NEIS|nr:murein transglycosylase A [Eikenella glucosivorans]MBH5328591.1 murein transglycosylase A [Eikenella glucosivorans]